MGQIFERVKNIVKLCIVCQTVLTEIKNYYLGKCYQVKGSQHAPH